MKSHILFLFVFGLLAARTSASASEPPQDDKGAASVANMLGQALLPVLAPSAQKVNMEKAFAKQTAKALQGITTPQQLDALQKMFEASIVFEEQLLQVYTEMQHLAGQMDTVDDPAERKRMSLEMKRLIEKYGEICDNREKAPVQAGLITQSALEGLLAVPEIQAVKEAIKKLVLAQFYKYT